MSETYSNDVWLEASGLDISISVYSVFLDIWRAILRHYVCCDPCGDAWQVCQKCENSVVELEQFSGSNLYFVVVDHHWRLQLSRRSSPKSSTQVDSAVKKLYLNKHIFFIQDFFCIYNNLLFFIFLMKRRVSRTLALSKNERSLPI